MKSLPDDQRNVIEELDSLVEKIHPQAIRSMKYGMPTYDMGGKMFACNAQKDYFSVYAESDLAKKYKSELKGLDVGKSCIRLPTLEKLP